MRENHVSLVVVTLSVVYNTSYDEHTWRANLVLSISLNVLFDGKIHLSDIKGPRSQVPCKETG